jgi:hypothetical protein
MANENVIDQNTEFFNQESFQAEVEQLYDPKIVQESRKRVARMTEEKLAAIKQEGESILRELAALRELGPEHPEVQRLIYRHHRNMENFYHVTKEIYQGLAEMYVLDPRFVAYFDQFVRGMADFLSQAMSFYSNTEFKEIRAANTR